MKIEIDPVAYLEHRNIVELQVLEYMLYLDMKDIEEDLEDDDEE